MNDHQSDQRRKAAAFFELHRRELPLVLPSVWDAGTARLITNMGFAALGISSAGVSFAKGRRDGAGLLELEELFQNAREVVDATPLPVIGDLENGYSDDAEGVAAVIRLAMRAGLAGCTIEDTTGRATEPIYGIEAAAGRIAAASQAAHEKDSRFVVIARCDNFLHGVHDIEDTIRRLRRYQEAGADIAYVCALPSIEAVRRVCEAVSIPVAVLLGRGGAYSAQEVAQAGARQIALGAALARVAYGEMLRAGRDLAAGNYDFLNRTVAFEELNDQMAEVHH